jgi:2-methylcitrate dehydratase PrpD
MVLRQPTGRVKSGGLVVLPTHVGHVATGTVTAIRSDRRLADFIDGLSLGDVPGPTQKRAALLVADLAAVCVAGRPAPASRIALEYARAVHAGTEATSLLDGSRLGAAGAAFANAVLANVLDFDDGHRLTKGHPGAVVIPAALAVAQLVDASPAEFMSAVIVGYEVAIRAGIALHGRDPAYHASGAWGGLGAAAATARLLGLSADQTIAALGLAEYHAPIAPIMRSCAEPQMTKDACGWGAVTGVSSALLAARGFTSVRAEFLDSDLDDLGERWALQELYIKAYPCCRWSQGAIAAARAAGDGKPLGAADIERVRIRTFAAADGLAKVVPVTTEEAQYNLIWPVACVLVRGEFGVDEVLGPFTDPGVAAVFARTDVVVDPELTAAFPQRRLTAVEISLGDGRSLSAGPVEAAGEPGDPGLGGLVAAKVKALMGPQAAAAAPPETVGLSRLTADQLVGLMCDAGPVVTHA